MSAGAIYLCQDVVPISGPWSAMLHRKAQGLAAQLARCLRPAIHKQQGVRLDEIEAP